MSAAEEEFAFENAHLVCRVQLLPDERYGALVRIEGRVLRPEQYASMELVAASPPERRVSYTGSALPYPCAAVAFCNTPNRAALPPDGLIDVAFAYPNAYYTPDWHTKVAPSVFVVLRPAAGDPVFVRLELPDLHALKTLVHRPERSGPAFYARTADILGVQGQEAILRAVGAVKEHYGVA